MKQTADAKLEKQIAAALEKKRFQEVVEVLGKVLRRKYRGRVEPVDHIIRQYNTPDYGHAAANRRTHSDGFIKFRGSKGHNNDLVNVGRGFFIHSKRRTHIVAALVPVPFKSTEDNISITVKGNDGCYDEQTWIDPPEDIDNVIDRALATLVLDYTPGDKERWRRPIKAIREVADAAN